jgi:IstB-like ATP binding protein
MLKTVSESPSLLNTDCFVPVSVPEFRSATCETRRDRERLAEESSRNSQQDSKDARTCKRKALCAPGENRPESARHRPDAHRSDLAVCQRGHRFRFTTTTALVSELIEARDERKLLRCQKQIASYELLIVDELGFVPLSKTGAELLFEMLSQRYQRGSTLITSNLPFQEWTEVLGSERLTGPSSTGSTTHVHILEMNGDRCRLKQSRR